MTWRELLTNRKQKLIEELKAIDAQLTDPHWCLDQGSKSADEDIQLGFEAIADEYGKWCARDLLDEYDYATFYQAMEVPEGAPDE